MPRDREERQGVNCLAKRLPLGSVVCDPAAGG